MMCLLIAVWTLRVSHHHNHQPSQEEHYRTCKDVVGRQAQMIVQESARGMMQVKGSEKVPTTPTTPTAR